MKGSDNYDHMSLGEIKEEGMFEIADLRKTMNY